MLLLWRHKEGGMTAETRAGGGISPQESERVWLREMEYEEEIVK